MKTGIREQKIISILESRGEMSVSALSEYLGVSVSTLRKQLADMQSRKLIIRTYGGVMSANRFPENDYRQWEIEQRVILCRFRVIRHRLDIRKQRFSAARAHDQRVNYKCKDDNAFRSGKVEVLRDQRRHREHDQEEHKRPCIRFKQSL